MTEFVSNVKSIVTRPDTVMIKEFKKQIELYDNISIFAFGGTTSIVLLTIAAQVTRKLLTASSRLDRSILAVYCGQGFYFYLHGGNYNQMLRRILNIAAISIAVRYLTYFDFLNIADRWKAFVENLL